MVVYCTSSSSDCVYRKSAIHMIDSLWFNSIHCETNHFVFAVRWNQHLVTMYTKPSNSLICEFAMKRKQTKRNKISVCASKSITITSENGCAEKCRVVHSCSLSCVHTALYRCSNFIQHKAERRRIGRIAKQRVKKCCCWVSQNSSHW